ncbi:response regulator [Gemmatimonas sp.]|uniref:hybrid sensor histidine kinase/response regulator n=1 Tax=Gemmatimonas sp. TaxID=1962908 RepID=UPI00398334D9
MTGKPLRVVIADDNPDDRREIRRLLLTGSESRYEFVECESASAALRLVMESPTNPPDCLLLDFYLPDMDAPELLSALHTAEGLTACAVLVLTGNADSSHGRQVLRLGAQDFIGKDWLTAPGLSRAVENAMERWSMAGSLLAGRRELEARERQLRSLANNTPDILTRSDRSYRHLFVNAAGTRATGRPGEEIIGRTNRELGMPEALCDRWEAALARVFEGGTTEEVEFSFDGLGGLAHYTSRFVPEYDELGRIEQVLGVTRDDTQRRQAELELRESAQRQQMALTAAKASAWSWDIQSGGIESSAEHYRLSDGSPALSPPVYGDGLSTIHPDDRAGAESAVRDSLSGKVAEFRAEFRLLQGHEDPRWFLGIGTVEFNPAGAAVRMVGINLDIHERKREELTLRDEVRSKDEFLATLSHELRNPLAPLTNAIELLKIAPPGAAAAESALAIMERQVKHLTRLVDDLLDVARIRHGKIALKVTVVSLGDVVLQAVEACQPLIDRAQHTLTVVVEPPLIAVKGDDVRLTQMLTNVLNNAVKYTPNGGHIDLRACIEDGQAVLRVIDNGAGIPPAMLSDVFELFTQVESTRDRAGGGLGIGLSLVQNVVKLHGGTVRGHSRGLGLGATFEIRLPLLVAHEADVNHQANRTLAVRAPAGDGPLPGHVGRRILLIDDNVDGTETMASMLRLRDHQVWTEYDGAAGLATAKAIRPDIMLVDIGLPTIDGHEVARRVRADPSLRDVRLIALTGWGSAHDQGLALQAGFDFHCTKPVDLTALEMLLEPTRSAPSDDRADLV